MGESHGWLFEPTFNRSIKLRQADPRISSNAGTLLLREVDHRLGLTADLAAELTDPRDPAHSRYTQTELLRQHLYSLALGHPHGDDADTLAHDVAIKLSVWDRPGRRVVNEASLLLKLLAFNLAGMIRGELEDASGNGWDLGRVQQTVLRAGARVVEHGKRIIVDVARAAGVLWGRLLERVNRWWRPTGANGQEVWGRLKPRPRPRVAPPSHAHLCLILRE